MNYHEAEDVPMSQVFEVTESACGYSEEKVAVELRLSVLDKKNLAQTMVMDVEVARALVAGLTESIGLLDAAKRAREDAK